MGDCFEVEVLSVTFGDEFSIKILGAEGRYLFGFYIAPRTFILSIFWMTFRIIE